MQQNLHMIKGKKEVLKWPLFIIELYLFIILFLFVFGPRKWIGINLPLTAFYIILNYFTFALGYLINARRRLIYYKEIIKNTNATLIFIKYTIIFSVIINFFVLLSNLQLNEISFSSLIKAIIRGFQDPGSAYYSKPLATSGTFTFFIVLFSVIVWPAIPLTLCYWGKINLTIKILAVFNILIVLFNWIIQGTNKGIFDIVFMIFYAYIVNKIINFYFYNQKCFTLNINLIEKRLEKRKKLIVFFIIMIFGSFAVYYFTSTIVGRTGRTTIQPSAYFEFDYGNFLWKITPDALKTTFGFLHSYVTQGYYAVGLALKEPSVFMFGIGSSPFLIDNFSSILNEDLIKCTLQYKIYLSTGWHYSVQWHSLIVWLANDVTLWCVPIVMFLLGGFICQLIRDLIEKRDLVSVVLLALMSLTVFYFSANNQIMNSSNTAFCFIVFFCIWLFKKLFTKVRQ